MALGIPTPPGASGQQAGKPLFRIASHPTSATLAEDPAFLAYQRSSQLDDAFDVDDAATAEALLRTRAVTDTEDIARQGQRDREQIGFSYESRGLAGSGMEARSMARQRGDEGRAVSRMTQDVEDTIGRYRTDLVRNIIRRRARGADQSLVSFDGLARLS
jgi:hypothetical protein